MRCAAFSFHPRTLMLDNYAGPKVRVLKWVKDEARAADGDKRLKVRWI